MRTCKQIIAKRRELWDTYKSNERDEEFIKAALQYIVDEHNVSVREDIKNHPEYLIEIAFVIVDKDKKTIPFFLNEVQQSFLNDINQAKRDFAAGKRFHLKFLVHHSLPVS